MKQLNEQELKIIIVVSRKDTGSPKLTIGAKYRIESDDLSEVRSVVVEASGKVKTQLLSFAKTVVTLIKQKEGIDA